MRKIALILLVLALGAPLRAVSAPQVSEPVSDATSSLAQAVAAPVAGNCDSYRPLIERYDWDANMVIDIARAESTCDNGKDNLNDVHRNAKGAVVCYGSFGLLQVGCVHYSKGESRRDLSLNIEKAYKLYVARGHSFKDWSTCKKIAGCS